MNEKVFLMAFLVILLPTVTALYGGETWSYHFPFCNQLIVNITGTETIEPNEYTILNNCTGENNNYICNCTNDYYFNVSFKTNALNNYSFLFNYDYSKEVETIKSSPSGTSSGVFTLRFTDKPRTLMMKHYIYSRFWVNGEQHTIRITDIGKDWIKLEIKSELMNITIRLNEPKEVKIDDHTLKIELKEIRGSVAFIEFTKIEKIKEEPEIVEIEEDEINLTSKIEEKENVTEPKDDRPTEKDEKWIYLGIILITILFIIFSFYVIKRKSKSKGSKKEESL